MEQMLLDSFEKNRLQNLAFDRAEKMTLVNKMFPSAVKPENGAYGTQIFDKGDGRIEKQSRNDLGHLKKEYFQNDKLLKVMEKLDDKTVRTVRFDDAGLDYLSEVAVKDGNTIKERIISLRPGSIVRKGNFTAVIDELGRPISNKVTDLQINEGRGYLSPKLRDGSYRPSDQRGHLIADIFGGPSTKENIVPQLDSVNMSKMRRIEEYIRRLKDEGHSVDYEVKSNYVGKSMRPSSFEVSITVDGKPHELQGEMAGFKKIFNGDYGASEQAAIRAGEKVTSVATKATSFHGEGLKQGRMAVEITAAISTVDNISSYAKGEISGEEMVMNIAEETGKAGIVGYGAGFISKGIEAGMSSSGKQLIKSLAGAGVPAAMVSFGIETYDSVIDYAQGKCDGVELAYDLAGGAASVAGSIAGAETGAMVGTAIFPGAGTVAGGLVGGMVGYVVTTEAYETAVEYGTEGAEYLKEKAATIADETAYLAKEYIPEKADQILTAITDYNRANGLHFGS